MKKIQQRGVYPNKMQFEGKKKTLYPYIYKSSENFDNRLLIGVKFKFLKLR